MATLTPHAPGTFSWPELGTTDQESAKKFYTALFGWTAKDTPMGPGETYTIFQKNEKDVGALYTLRAEQKQHGVPPNWGAYISVANADETAAKAKQLGGTLLAEPFDVMEHGRMAIIQDPNGAVFQVWQAKQHIGAGLIGEPYTLCWTELMTSDPEKSKAFYTGLIGYTSEDMPVPGGQGTYTIFKRADGTQAAGMMKIPDQMQGVPSHWLSYFAVEDIQATVGKLSQIGGKVQVPPTPIPGIGTFSVVQDPQGAYFALLQPATS